MAGSRKSGADLRKHRRKPFQLIGRICTDDLSLPYDCLLNDISDGGARLTLKSEDESVPEEFMLLLSRNEKIRRHCRIAWRDGAMLGVKFIGAPQPGH